MFESLMNDPMWGGFFSPQVETPWAGHWEATPEVSAWETVPQLDPNGAVIEDPNALQMLDALEGESFEDRLKRSRNAQTDAFNERRPEESFEDWRKRIG